MFWLWLLKTMKQLQWGWFQSPAIRKDWAFSIFNSSLLAKATTRCVLPKPKKRSGKCTVFYRLQNVLSMSQILKPSPAAMRPHMAAPFPAQQLPFTKQLNEGRKAAAWWHAPSHAHPNHPPHCSRTSWYWGRKAMHHAFLYGDIFIFSSVCLLFYTARFGNLSPRCSPGSTQNWT